MSMEEVREVESITAQIYDGNMVLVNAVDLVKHITVRITGCAAGSPAAVAEREWREAYFAHAAGLP